MPMRNSLQKFSLIQLSDILNYRVFLILFL
jgi:hypothetical protein